MTLWPNHALQRTAGSTRATDADIIRQYWPHRLVQPEWISAAPDSMDRLMKWHIYETTARLSVIGVFWSIIAGGAAYRFVRGTRQRPNKSLQPMPGSGGSSAARFTSTGPAWLSFGR
jgi:hypothetical protein